MDISMDISMDIHGKYVDMDMDGKFHVHGRPVNRTRRQMCAKVASLQFINLPIYRVAQKNGATLLYSF